MAKAKTGFWADFRAFLARGNVLDLAIAVVIGGAFGKIISSLVEDVITPAILSPALEAAGVDQLQNLAYNGIRYGVFLAAVLNFLVIAFCIFLLIRSIENAQRRFWRQKGEPAAPSPEELQMRTAESLDRLSKALEARRV
jgi:large conductance mechanosensitive channel